MDILIKIPKEFETHFNKDKFADSLGRVLFDLEQCNKHGSPYDALSGNYELETIKMLKKAMEQGTVLPSTHGKLKDSDKLINEIKEYISDTSGLHYTDLVEVEAINLGIQHALDEIEDAETLIEAND